MLDHNSIYSVFNLESEHTINMKRRVSEMKKARKSGGSEKEILPNTAGYGVNNAKESEF